jgi:hypothetical protein
VLNGTNRDQYPLGAQQRRGPNHALQPIASKLQQMRSNGQGFNQEMKEETRADPGFIVSQVITFI